MILLAVIILVTMTLSTLCSLAEACLLSLSRPDLARLIEQRPAAGMIWQRLKSNIQIPIAAILIVNTCANIGGAFFTGQEVSKLVPEKWNIVFSIVFAYVLIQWCEILPKTLGVRHSLRIAGVAAKPFSFVVKLLTPIIRLIEFINRPLAGRKRYSADSSLSDISVLAHAAAHENLISREQESLIAQSVRLSIMTARDIMISREDINVLSTSMTLHEGFIAAHLHRHTRFPLAENGELDRIAGYANFKDIVGALHINPADPSMRGIMRPVLFAPEDARLPDLMKKLTKGYQHIAVIQDPGGRTVGLVTLEDIIETLVGDLQDEYDAPPDFIVRLSETRFRVGGGASFRQIKSRAFPEFPRDEETSINQWFKDLSEGEAPPENHVETIAGFSVRVRRVVRGNIYDTIVEKTL